MNEELEDSGKYIIQDPNSISADPDLPAFIARPEGAPLYHGFSILENSETEGWRLGVITEFEGEQWGDAFAIAPDGARCGLNWELGELSISPGFYSNYERFGVFNVGFPFPVHTEEDMIRNFRAILPLLQEKHKLAKANVKRSRWPDKHPWESR